ncbi:hypothetical protein BDZ85DRAFT_265922 [Elsinoe ampelina]|uniref:Secreted protein n=1 Tax=Elsinoe ampelina TaxID=302913 RepID=A0A6A6G643_9PEZI|nr:hypothetical protein BDZ85DRAFT_265922 [Elsinoe ampelina]
MHKPAWTLTHGCISRLLVALNLGRSCIVNLIRHGASDLLFCSLVDSEIERRLRSCDIAQTGPTNRLKTRGKEK